MPPKGWRKTASGFQPTNSSGVNIKDRKVHGIEELLLPRTLVAKIAKQSLPENTPLPKDGVTALMRSATMFTSYITAQANEIAQRENRKTVTHTDILAALETCHFGSFVNASQELSEQVVVKTKSSSETSTVKNTEGNDENDENDEDDYIEEDAEPQADFVVTSSGTEQKRPRISTAEPDSDDMQVER